MPGLVLGVVEAPIDETSLLVIVGAAALAGMLVMLASPKLVIPVVVVELILGIIVGPQVAGLADVDPTTDFLGSLGLGMLFFFAGYEINFERIRAGPWLWRRSSRPSSIRWSA
jgi:Kef-type K+ transport system membrane component KefB